MRTDHIVEVARSPLLDLIGRWFHPVVRMLIVVDTEIDLSPGAGSFGIERVIRLLRDSSIGCLHFRVDIGQRSSEPFSVVASPVGTEPKYRGFRFDAALANGSNVLQHYDEVWCFGFKPGNDNGPDSNISRPGVFAATDAELEVLTQWMNAGGGIFATGDHDYLGASMCSRIPRIGTMRAWSNAQGVPPIGGPSRIDTNRPFNPAEQAGTEVIEFDRQSDPLPQKIRWVPWMSFGTWFHRIERPHPVLCHPTLGPINVMPDHPHEGVVFDHVAQPDVGLAPITLTNTYSFGATSGPEYPTVASVQALPMVIAYGRTLPDPPYMQEKGDSPEKRFAMISVYDGHRVNVGRAATDSTWHHWMNLNLAGLETAGGSNWEKISRYFLNLAVWLAPSRIARDCFHFHVLESFYAYPGIEEFHSKSPLLETGISLRNYLKRIYGPCWVSHFVIDWFRVADSALSERLAKIYLALPVPKGPFPPRPEPCYTCPPPDMLEAAVLGSVVHAAAELLQAEGVTIEETLKRLRSIEPEQWNEKLLQGAATGIKQIHSQYARSAKTMQELVAG